MAARPDLVADLHIVLADAVAEDALRAGRLQGPDGRLAAFGILDFDVDPRMRQEVMDFGDRAFHLGPLRHFIGVVRMVGRCRDGHGHRADRCKKKSPHLVSSTGHGARATVPQPDPARPDSAHPGWRAAVWDTHWNTSSDLSTDSAPACSSRRGTAVRSGTSSRRARPSARWPPRCRDGSRTCGLRHRYVTRQG